MFKLPPTSTQTSLPMCAVPLPSKMTPCFPFFSLSPSVREEPSSTRNRSGIDVWVFAHGAFNAKRNVCTFTYDNKFCMIGYVDPLSAIKIFSSICFWLQLDKVFSSFFCICLNGCHIIGTDPCIRLIILPAKCPHSVLCDGLFCCQRHGYVFLRFQ